MTDKAPCFGMTDLFFPTTRREREHAQTVCPPICQTCETQVDCYEGALARREQDGVWGGVLFVSNGNGGCSGRPYQEPKHGHGPGYRAALAKANPIDIHGDCMTCGYPSLHPGGHGEWCPHREEAAS